MGSTRIEQASQPTVSSAEAIREWVSSMPQVYETQMRYAPLEAAQQVQLAQQYAQPLGEALLTAQKAMYPEEYALRSDLMKQAQEGMATGVPDWMRQRYQGEMRAQLGENAISGSGADYMSRGLLQQQQDWQNYYRNMAMSLGGSQPVYGANLPGYSNYMSSFTPQSTLGYYQGYGTQTQTQGTNPWQWMSGVGNLMGSTAGGGKGFMGWF